MSYLDNLTQGLSNTYSQVYRKPRYTQIGNTSLQMPRTISLDQMYAAPKIETAPPQLRTPQYTVPMPQEGIPATGQRVPDIAIEEAGYAQYQDRNTGQSVWMPSQTAQGGALPEGIQYDNASGKWVWSAKLGTWLATKLEDGKYIISPDQPFTTQDIGGYANKIVAYTQAGRQTTQDQYNVLINQINEQLWPGKRVITDATSAHNVFNQLDQKHAMLIDQWEDLNTQNQILENKLSILRRSHYTKSEETAILDKIADVEAQMEDVASQQDAVEAQKHYLWDNLANLDAMQDILNQSKQEGAQLEVQSWQDQMNTLMSDLQSGKWTTDTGQMDIEAMRNSNEPFTKWMADVLEQSYKTGSIMGDFVDENGNLAPELQAMSDYFQSPEQEQAYNKFSRELAFNALAKGQTLNSGYYSNYVADIVANRAAEISGQVSDVMMKDIEAQYTYIAESLKNMLVKAGRDAEAEALASQMDVQYATLQQQYQQQVDLLAAQAAADEAARTGDIFTGVLAAILSIVTAII